MKILLRNYASQQYVWKTAQYRNGIFFINTNKIKQNNIVSILNDNRKNRVECSCCGETFRKGDPSFHAHKENAIKPETCFNCPNMTFEYDEDIKRTLKRDKDGSFIQKSTDRVTLRCTRSGLWTYDNILSQEAINNCVKRRCANATEIEISDFFTKNPGAFDDILTIDALLDYGYNVDVCDCDNYCDLDYEEEYSIGACINKLGIVDCFYVWYDGDRHYLYYSKKYNELFHSDLYNRYDPWFSWSMSDEMRNEIKNRIARFYH